MHIILAAYRLDSLTSALGFIGRSFSRREGERRILVLNDARLVDGITTLARDWEILLGSNELGEFSAWQEGLERLGHSQQTVLFANDTINNHRHFTWLRVAALRRCMKTAKGRVFVGFKAAIEGRLTVAGLPFDHWVSTYCFALSAEALSALDYQVSDPVLAGTCVAGGTDESTFFARLSPALETHLRRWLFRGWWYAGGPLTAENEVRMTRKAKAIISEKLLSAKCQSLQIGTVDPLSNDAWRLLDGVIRRACKWRAQLFSRQAATMPR